MIFRRTFWEIFWKNLKNQIFIQALSGKVLAVWMVFPKMISTCPDKFFGDKKIEKKCKFVQNFFDFQRKFFRVWAAGVSKLHSTCPEEHFGILKKIANVNVFTPNWQIPEKKVSLVYILRERFSFRNIMRRGNNNNIMLFLWPTGWL